jgi:hypothetical protein
LAERLGAQEGRAIDLFGYPGTIWTSTRGHL